MSKITLKSIKLENADLVLKSIARKKHITKLEISEETGLSLMTVGKITDTLGAAGIIMHGKNITQKAGRRAEVLSMSRDWLIPVLDISTRNFRFYVTDLEGEVLDTVEYRCNEEPQHISIDFVRFLTLTLELLKRKYKNEVAMGIGVSISGVYNAEEDRINSTMMPEFASVKLMQNINKIFRQKIIVVDNANRLTAEGIIESQSDYREHSIACLTINESIECTSCEHGVYMRGATNLAGRFGDLPYGQSLTYANFLRDAQNVRDIIMPVSDIIRATAIAYDPDIIYLCSKKYSFSPANVDELTSILHNSLLWCGQKPKIVPIYSSDLESMSAIVSTIVGKWLRSIIISDT